MQRAIVGLLDGTQRRQVYAGAGPLQTSELLEELLACEAIADGKPWKQAMFTVRRACVSLVRRAMIEGEYIPDADNPGRETIQWAAIED